MRAVIYVRISRDATGEGLGVERQRRECAALAAAREWTLIDTIVENDVSATKGGRPGFARLLGLIDACAVDVVVVWAADRLVRRLVDLEDVIARCERSGVKLATVSGDLDLSTDQGRLVARILASVARGEVERKSARQKAAYAQLAERGLPHHGGRTRPFGYLDDRVTPHPQEAPAVVEAYSLILAGGALGEVGRRWRSLGTHPALWRSSSSVARALCSPRYAGFREHNGEVAGPAAWQGLVAEETWRAVRDILTDPSRARPPHARRSLLGGLATCAVCGGPIEGNPRHGQPGYRCAEGHHIHRRAAGVDDYVTSIVLERLSRNDARDLLGAHDRADVAALSTKATALRTRLEVLATEFADGTLTSAQLRAATERLRTKLADVEQQIADAGQTSALTPLVTAQDVRAVWDELPLSQQRAVIDTLMTVTLQRSGRGARRFTPDTVEIEWKSGPVTSSL
ncbi:DNA invertase Pin-like site-specific DNA recombinase [Actinomycetospora cinnamomea]|uniref:DNA invertase Pin-like site-specific DNA recombinase n=2 Tax=Actinomycetospora cinnamomea TaxID=663609 RepID=A0A2U1F6Q5_9PSEU|nr:recombinase family protein [Actinomycetospora cinnamomea]PVZ07863.1 DNA invertase Pin-like site-specific DNA recombinase [Actinomycetospora cinnamomea]